MVTVKLEVLIYVYVKVVMIYFLTSDVINVYMKVIMIYFLTTDVTNVYVKVVMIYFLIQASFIPINLGLQ